VALDFGTHEDVVFERAPLVSVLTQIRFPPVLSLMSAAGVAGFQTAIRDSYPTMLPAQRTATIAMGEQTVGVEQKAPTWRMQSQDGNWTVGVAADFISLETPSYSSIDEFLARCAEVLRAIHRTIRPAASVRVGLRKVNLLRYDGEQENLSSIVRPEVLGSLAVRDFPAPLTNYFSQFEFTEDDNKLVVRCGLVIHDDEPGFLLDCDCFTERPYPIDGRDTLIGLLRHFSDGITSFFHWSIQDAYKRQLGPRPRGAGEGVPK